MVDFKNSLITLSLVLTAVWYGKHPVEMEGQDILHLTGPVRMGQSCHPNPPKASIPGPTASVRSLQVVDFIVLTRSL